MLQTGVLGAINALISITTACVMLISITTAFTICTFTMDPLGTFNLKKVVISELAVLLNFMEHFSVFHSM